MLLNFFLDNKAVVVFAGFDASAGYQPTGCHDKVVCQHFHSSAMSFLSKLFGTSKPELDSKPIPDAATPRDVIVTAVNSVIGRDGGNCATLEFDGDSAGWIQIMDCTINCHYPHEESPDSLFPGLIDDPLVAGLEGFEAGSYMTVGLRHMNVSEIADWIERYLSQVFQADPHAARIHLRMEEL